jgi:predicted dehydrogenase
MATQTKKTKVGIIGTGNISGIYLYNCYRIKNLELVAMADLVAQRPKDKIEEIKAKYSTEWKLPGEPKLPIACPVSELLANPEIEMVINLTWPKAHAEVATQCLEAGKHAYSEKPFSTKREDGQRILALAKKKKLRIGCAPDTFLGAGIQTCRKLVDDGWIGKPVGFTAFMTCPGHETWHPDPEFYYEVGGGPRFDMGPYYLTALINLMGPIKRIGGMAKIVYPERTITSPKKYGKVVKVETPTTITSTLEFACGAIGTMIMSFDIFGAELPRIEVYGTNGSISVPDPNGFGGEIKVKVGRNNWGTVPHSHGYSENARGLGAADMASALASGRPHRASGELAFHVLDVMQGSLDAAATGKVIEIASKTDRPAALPLGLRDGDID